MGSWDLAGACSSKGGEDNSESITDLRTLLWGKYFKISSLHNRRNIFRYMIGDLMRLNDAGADLVDVGPRALNSDGDDWWHWSRPRRSSHLYRESLSMRCDELHSLVAVTTSSGNGIR